MTTDFARTMTRLPDEELFRIAYPDVGEDYALAAITAAQAEIDKRGISQEEVRQIRYEIYQEREDRLPIAEEPLGKSGRVMFVVGAPFLGLIFFAILVLFITGYREKAFNAAAYVAIGLAGYCCLGGAILILLWLLG